MSIIALVVSILTLLMGLLCLPFALWIAISPGPIPGGEFDPTGAFFGLLWLVGTFCFGYLWPLVAIGLVLSIVTLFIEPNKRLRLLPLLFILLGVCLVFLPQALKRRAEHKAMDKLTGMERHKKPDGRPKKESQDTTLSSLGISRDQSHRWQQEASVAAISHDKAPERLCVSRSGAQATVLCAFSAK